NEAADPGEAEIGSEKQVNLVGFGGKTHEGTDESLEKSKKTLRLFAVGPVRKHSRSDRERIHRPGGGSAELRLVKDGDILINRGASGKEPQPRIVLRLGGTVRRILLHGGPRNC
ncbi:MAG: hypothetical protein DRI57_05195, partial [Deltaproteobacteria bacterium]